MKKIVLAALLAATAMSTAHADAYGDRCAATYSLAAAVTADINPEGAKEYRTEVARMLDVGLASYSGMKTAEVEVAGSMSSIDDLLNEVGICQETVPESPEDERTEAYTPEQAEDIFAGFGATAEGGVKSATATAPKAPTQKSPTDEWNVSPKAPAPAPKATPVPVKDLTPDADTCAAALITAAAAAGAQGNQPVANIYLEAGSSVAESRHATPNGFEPLVPILTQMALRNPAGFVSLAGGCLNRFRAGGFE